MNNIEKIGQKPLASYRDKLPQLNNKNMITCWGMGTWLQFADGFDAPHFTTFQWLENPKSLQALRDFHRKVARAAVSSGFGVVTDGLHYRTSRDWCELAGYSERQMIDANFREIEFCKEIAAEFDSPETPMPLGGAIGPRGDAYDKGHVMGAAEAEDYHSEQIGILKDAGADLITAATFTSVDEAVGVIRASVALDMPVAVSFTLTTEGVLLSGMTLQDAIEQTDAQTDNGAAYFTVNCAHPTEIEPALQGGDWGKRLLGFMPNAVSLEKGQLCSLGHIEDGDPVELGQQMGSFAKRFPHMRVWGGCCGTDARHIGEICRSVMAAQTR